MVGWRSAMPIGDQPPDRLRGPHRGEGEPAAGRRNARWSRFRRVAGVEADTPSCKTSRIQADGGTKETIGDRLPYSPHNGAAALAYAGAG